MKSIMYHYVRNKNKLFPNYNILKKKDYIKQIKKFSKIGLINSYEEGELRCEVPKFNFLSNTDQGGICVYKSTGRPGA